MARQNRLAPAAVPIHLLQNGIKRQRTFRSDDDFYAYLTWLKEYSEKYEVQIHSWVLMPTHVHILCTPTTEGGVSRMMQTLGRLYVRYFNRKNNRTGKLWEGRYRSCIVQSNHYLLEVQRYIEQNPVRARLARHPADYIWSSFHANALGQSSDICTPHNEFLKMGSTQKIRRKNYIQFTQTATPLEIYKDIQESTFKCLAFGDQEFKEKVQEITGRILIPKKRTSR